MGFWNGNLFRVFGWSKDKVYDIWEMFKICIFYKNKKIKE